MANMLGQLASNSPTYIKIMTEVRQKTDSVIERRFTAERDDDFVVFHIGMRINTVWKLHRWLPVFLLASRMVRRLRTDPESGLLGSRTVLGPGGRHIGFVQYWESFDALREYARDGGGLHLPAWKEYYRNGTDEDAAVGIWHETYLVRAGEYETVYNNVPPHGLGACDGTDIVPATERRRTAAGRVGRTDGTDTVSDFSEDA